MVEYRCYDKYGKLVTTARLECNNLATMIIKYEDNYYRPTSYRLTDEGNVAICCPVKVVEVQPVAGGD